MRRRWRKQYGDETGKVLTYLTSVFGLPPQSSLTLVETEPGTPNGYAAQGLIFLSPRSIGKQVNPRLLANQISRQWLGVLVSPTTRNNMWLVNGGARYSELLYLEHLNGAGALENEVRDTLHRSFDPRERSRHAVGTFGGLFTRVLGCNGGQRRRGHAHASGCHR